MDPNTVSTVAAATGIGGGLVTFVLAVYGSGGRRWLAPAALGSGLGVLLYLVTLVWLDAR